MAVDGNWESLLRGISERPNIVRLSIDGYPYDREAGSTVLPEHFFDAVSQSKIVGI
jgi:hypothetical protein